MKARLTGRNWDLGMKSLLHRHSTLFGLGGALFLTLLAGITTRWNVVVTVIVGLTALWFLPRLAYGRDESESLDAERNPDSPLPRTGYIAADPAERVYLGLQSGFDSKGQPVESDALRKLAEEEA